MCTLAHILSCPSSAAKTQPLLSLKGCSCSFQVTPRWHNQWLSFLSSDINSACFGPSGWLSGYRRLPHKHGGLSSIRSTHVKGGENWLHRCPLASTCPLCRTCPLPRYTQRHILVIFKDISLIFELSITRTSWSILLSLASFAQQFSEIHLSLQISVFTTFLLMNRIQFRAYAIINLTIFCWWTSQHYVQVMLSLMAFVSLNETLSLLV